MRCSRIAAAAWRRINSNFLNFYIEPRASAQAFWHGSGVIFPLRPDPRLMPGGLQWSVNVSRSNLQPSSLDVPTLAFVATCIAALLGVFLILAWLQQRDARALAWWGTAYLIGASSMVLWSAPALFASRADRAGGADFRRLRHDLERRAPIPWTAAIAGRHLRRRHRLAGALPDSRACRRQHRAHGARRGCGRRGYTFFIAFEFWRERRKSLIHARAAIW